MHERPSEQTVVPVTVQRVWVCMAICRLEEFLRAFDDFESRVSFERKSVTGGPVVIAMIVL